MGRAQADDTPLPSDPELIAAVRGGDVHAYGTLFERHRGAALSLARQIARPSDVDDLVSDAFTKVLRVLSSGGGPDVAFRAYLLTAVRRLHVDRIRAAAKVTPSDDLERWDPGVPFTDPVLAEFENATAARALASLPERWQLVLWHLEVEGQKPAEVAPLLGLSANSVSALGYRAREGLRQAYIQMHLADTAAEDCRWTTERLGAHVRNGLSRRDAGKVNAHLDQCIRCAAVYLELSEVNSNLSAVVAPILLGTAAAGYLASVAAASAATAGTATGIGSWLMWAQGVAQANTVAAAAGVAGSAVAVSVSAAVVVHGMSSPPPSAREAQNVAGPVIAGLDSSNPPGSGPSAEGPWTSTDMSGLLPTISLTDPDLVTIPTPAAPTSLVVTTAPDGTPTTTTMDPTVPTDTSLPTAGPTYNPPTTDVPVTGTPTTPDPTTSDPTTSTPTDPTTTDPTTSDPPTSEQPTTTEPTTTDPSETLQPSGGSESSTAPDSSDPPTTETAE